MRTIFAALVLAVASVAAAEESKPPEKKADDADHLAKQLQNPVADLVSFPFQGNFDFGIGERENGEAFLLNIQPVIPLHLSDKWNLITRTILPIQNQQDVFGEDTRVDGLGDVNASLFFSPAEKGPGGLIFGAGPAIIMPTASEDVLGTGKWSAGPTFVALLQEGKWTFGALASHVWSFAGRDSRDEVNSTFIQPFVAHTFGRGFTAGVNMENTYDWRHDEWNLPVNVFATQVLPVFGQLVSVQAGVRYYFDTFQDSDGPEWGIRFGIILIFPRGK